MPSKIQLDENLWFLYICIQKSDLKTIDFNAVGLAASLKPPAARMRYTRLRRQIESGLLLTHAPTPSSPTRSVSPQPAPPSLSQPLASSSSSFTKPITRKRKIRADAEPPAGSKRRESADDGGDEQEAPPPRAHQGARRANLPSSRLKLKREIKVEGGGGWASPAPSSSSSRFSSFSSSSSSSSREPGAGDSEDEMPLRKRRALQPDRRNEAPQVPNHSQHQEQSQNEQRSAAPSPSPAQDQEREARQRGVAAQGYNTYAQAPRPLPLLAEPGAGYAHELQSVGYKGQAGVYASPYAGWIEGRDSADETGKPAPAPGGLGLGLALGSGRGEGEGGLAQDRGEREGREERGVSV